ncbi:hypothetical protein [Methylophilus sp.]|uniref:hypothetical protein n=1 Tax=Methylophilus sp. TaxID=29541 RepID=UPI0039C9F9EA
MTSAFVEAIARLLLLDLPVKESNISASTAGFEAFLACALTLAGRIALVLLGLTRYSDETRGLFFFWLLETECFLDGDFAIAWPAGANAIELTSKTLRQCLKKLMIHLPQTSFIIAQLLFSVNHLSQFFSVKN